MTRISVVYYSATGNVHALARAVADGAASEGARVRLRQVAELPAEMQISVKQHWGRHRSELEDQAEAQLEDIEWADGLAFGTPTRFGNVAAQLKGLPRPRRRALATGCAGGQGRYRLHVVADRARRTGVHDSCPQQHALSLGRDRPPPRLHGAHEVFNGGGNPYGASFTSDHQTTGPDENTLVVARAQGARLTRVARAIRVAREAGLLTATAAAKSNRGAA